MVSAMRDLTIIVLENLDITSPMDVYQMVAYMQRILRGKPLKKYKAILLECKQSAKDIAEDKWTFVELKWVYIEDFFTWAKSYRLAYERYA